MRRLLRIIIEEVTFCVVVMALALFTALFLGGCVQMRIAAYYAPPVPPEPCQVDVTEDGRYKGCISHAHAQEILKDMAPTSGGGW